MRKKRRDYGSQRARFHVLVLKESSAKVRRRISPFSYEAKRLEKGEKKIFGIWTPPKPGVLEDKKEKSQSGGESTKRAGISLTPVFKKRCKTNRSREDHLPFCLDSTGIRGGGEGFQKRKGGGG